MSDLGDYSKQPKGRPEAKDRFIWQEGDVKFLDEDTDEWVRLGEIPEKYKEEQEKLDKEKKAQDSFKEGDHPRDNDGKFASGSGSAGSAKSSQKMTFKKGNRPPPSLNGVKFSAFKKPKDWDKVEGQNDKIKEPPAPKLTSYEWRDKEGKTHSSKQSYSTGLIMQEPDGRIWLYKPTKGYGGYDYTFPKGGVEKGINPQANAIKEGFEETGLKGKITGYHGDYEGDTSVSRFYTAEREGGDPTQHGWEAEAVVLVSPEEAGRLLNRSRDKKILADFVKGKQAQDEFHEEDHPRGQPKNAGQFAEGSGGGQTAPSKSTVGKTNTSKPAPGSAQAHLVSLPKEKWPPHIQALKLPPAWQDVRVSPDPQASLQAIGKDTKGRPQYVYSEAFKESQTAKKFARIKKVDAKFDSMMKKNDANMKSRDERMKQHAQAAGLILDMGLRPGSERDTGAKEKAYGATTLEATHVISEGNEVRLQFTGKKGVKINLPVDNPVLAQALRERAVGGGQLFPRVSAESLGAYVKSLGGADFKTKDLRTLKANRMANQLISSVPAPTNAAEYKKAVRIVAVAVSSKLGNTPVVALQSYINPVVFAPWQGAQGK